MKGRYVVCIDDTTVEQQNKVTKYFKELDNVGYWHWYSDLWLVTDPGDQLSTEKIRQGLDALLPDANKIVIEVESGYAWSIFGKEDSFKWLHETWSD